MTPGRTSRIGTGSPPTIHTPQCFAIGATMDIGRVQNSGKLITPPPPIRRGLLVLVHAEPRRLTPDQWLERRGRELAAECKRVPPNNSSAYACRAVADMAQGLRFPLRVIAKIIVAVLKGGGPVDFGEKLGRAIITFNAQAAACYGRSVSPADPHGDDDEPLREVA